ncbi:hypothetical protein Acor_80540 [Acrocarpospora corrugata]|uniref:TniQ domain-containing protein n=1 Tax=Acrocarpospora corrugata TaxID=35763 RepID=A0A5M3WA93_9ACTN|nr:TniQ family protein [Acrocarpospora corrugata]GES05985.1 hypothetical protein Acor_80540 [Acrocarpospora corrugata]
MLRRLPITAPPATGETVKSYLQRLAALNGVDYPEIWDWVSEPEVPGKPRRIVVGPRLADLTGYPADRLGQALPELRKGLDWQLLRDTPQHPCPQCAARHPGGQVIRLFALHHYACRRHGYWIGPPDIGEGPHLPYLAGLPEVLQAQRRHNRLVRERGPVAAFDGIIHAFRVLTGIWRLGPAETHGTSDWWHWDRRVDLLIPKNQARELFSHSRCYAALYPEAVTIAALLTTPFWRTKATFPFGDADTDDRWDFTAEFGRRIGIEEYYPDDPNHPVHLWADHHASQPPMGPAKVFLDRRRHTSDGTAKTDQRLIDGHHKSAAIFAKRRFAANALTYHHHTMAPVIDTYLPRPGPYARQRTRLAAEAAAPANP